MSEHFFNRRSGKRLAPYPVWVTMRIVTMIGSAIIVFWFGWAMAALFAAINGAAVTLPPLWLGIVGLVVGGSGGGFRRDENLPPFGEIIGRMLASKHCPVCGQSLFDHTPPAGYAPDGQRYRWWPSRLCANCGHDMAVPEAS